MELEQRNDSVPKFLRLLPTCPKAVLYVAGAGGGLLQSLLTCPGVSNFLFEAKIPYSIESVHSTFCGTESSASARSQKNWPQSLCSLEASQLLCQRAVERCASLWAASNFSQHTTSVPSTNQSLPFLIGIGCSAALTTNRARRGTDRVFVTASVVGIEGFRMSVGLKLIKDGLTRLQQDAIVERVVYHCVWNLLLHSKRFSEEQILIPMNDNLKYLQANLANSEHLEMVKELPKLNLENHLECLRSSILALYNKEYEHILYFPSSQIIIPNVSFSFFSGCSIINSDIELFKILVLPGSFNPLHQGHIQLLKYGMNSSTDKTIGIFELSCINADKGVLNVDDIISRLSQFTSLPSSSILLTRAPLFQDKIKIFEKIPVTFLIGVDTYLRLIDKAYYEQSVSKLMMSFALFYFNNVRFMVFGRSKRFFPSAGSNVQQVFDDYTNLNKHSETDFVSLSSVDPLTFSCSCLSDIAKELFYSVPDFRMDISSSFLRAQNNSL